MPSSITKIIRWAARILSLIYTGFFLFFFIGESLPSLNHDQVQHFDTRSIILLSLLALYFLCLQLAWKWERLFGIISLLLIAFFISVTKVWSNPYFLIGVLIPVLYLIAGILENKTSRVQQ